MYPIRYYYTSLSKQFFLIALAVVIACRLAIYVLALSVVEGYAAETYIVPTVLVYLLAIAVCILFLFAFKVASGQFNDDNVTYSDKLKRKISTVSFEQICCSRFAKDGIYLYGDENREQILLKIPFHRFGKISPVGVENFMTMLRNKGILVEKEYEILSGYGPTSTWIARGYLCIGFIAVLHALKHLALVFSILTM